MRFMATALMLFTLSGCVMWRETPLTTSQPKPISLDADNAAKTLDFSYKFSGDDERWQAESYKKLIIDVYEHCGYIVNEMPWSSQPGKAARIRVEVVNSASRAWLFFVTTMTLGAIPGYGRFSASVSIDAHANGVMTTHTGTSTSKSFVWLPLFWLYYFNSKPVIVLQDEGIEEIIKGSIVRLRDEKILLSP